MSEQTMHNFAEAEGYLRGLDGLAPPEAYIAVVAAQAHATLAQAAAAAQMVELQRTLLASMVPTSAEPKAAETPNARLSRLSVEAHQAKLAADQEAYSAGWSGACNSIHGRLQLLHAEAITSERKNALEKAIQAVEELAP